MFFAGYVLNNNDNKQHQSDDWLKNINMEKDFRNYAVKHLGMNGLALDGYAKITSKSISPTITSNFISPTIIEERQLNVAQMDVFSRLMMDRIIFLGTQIDDYTANVIQAQLLYLDSADTGKDISIYINSPGGSVYADMSFPVSAESR